MARSKPVRPMTTKPKAPAKPKVRKAKGPWRNMPFTPTKAQLAQRVGPIHEDGSFQVRRGRKYDPELGRIVPDPKFPIGRPRKTRRTNI